MYSDFDPGFHPMPRYHFDLRDGEAFVLDEEGMELPDIESAQMEAAEFLSDTVKELIMRRSDPSGYPMAIEVRDPKGRLFNLASCFPCGSGTDSLTRPLD